MRWRICYCVTIVLSNYVPRYTVEDHALWEGEWELWSGAPVAMSPSPDMVHQVLVGRMKITFCDLTFSLFAATP